MKIDLHCHFSPQEYLKELEASGVADPARVALVRDSLWEGVDARLAAMADARVDMEVLSVSVPNVFFDDSRVSLALAQICNDSLAELCSKHPDRFLGLVNVPLPDVSIAISELRRVRARPGMVGVALGTNIAGKPLDTPEFWPFYEELDRLRLPAFIHPMDPVGMPLVRDYAMVPMVGYLFETCIGATRLVLSGAREKYPNFPIVLCHLGGALPFISNRIDRNTNNNPEVRDRLSGPPSSYFRQMYFDIALSYGAIPLECAHQYLGDDQIVLGTDHPFCKADHKQVVPAIEAADLPAGTKEKIFFGNARRLLGLGDIRFR